MMQEKGPIVYVVQEPRFRGPDGELKTGNTLPAVKYGSLELLLSSEKQTNVLNAADTVRLLKAKLATFRDQDFILAAGDPAAIGMACLIAGMVNQGRVTILKWDRMERCYYPVPVDVRGS